MAGGGLPGREARSIYWNVSTKWERKGGRRGRVGGGGGGREVGGEGLDWVDGRRG